MHYLAWAGNIHGVKCDKVVDFPVTHNILSQTIHEQKTTIAKACSVVDPGGFKVPQKPLLKLI